MPALCVLLRQRESIWMLVFPETDLKRLHTLVVREQRMVGATGRDVDLV